MKASELIFKEDYPNFPEFEKYRIPLDRVDANLIVVLQRLRTISGVPVYPSPDPEGWARTRGDKESRHYSIGRLSDAGDIFPARGYCIDLFLRAQELPEIGGIGIYSDTRGPDGNPWPMIHIDLRPHDRTRTIWTRTGAIYGRKGTYFNLSADNFHFNQVLNEVIRLDKK